MKSLRSLQMAIFLIGSGCALQSIVGEDAEGRADDTEQESARGPCQDE